VDLQARYTIKKVEVVNRGDCCCKLILFIKCNENWSHVVSDKNAWDGFSF
jgi:hypothetical protein